MNEKGEECKTVNDQKNMNAVALVSQRISNGGSNDRYDYKIIERFSLEMESFHDARVNLDNFVKS